MIMGSKIVHLALALVYSLHASSTRIHMGADLAVAELVETPLPKVTEKDNRLCTVCEDFTSKALAFLEDKNNQQKVQEFLHEICLYTFSFEKECIESVEQYTTQLFAKIANFYPKDLCKSVYLCESRAHANELESESTCVFCHHLVEEILSKLKDPDAEFEIVEILLKQCANFEGYVQKCKRMVLQYVPIILVNGEKFLEKNDVCAALGVCPAQHKSYFQPLLSEA